MNIAGIICTFIVIIDLVKTRSTESKEFKKIHKATTAPEEISDFSHTKPDENHTVPKIHTEDDSGEVQPSYLMTTRRPLMKSRKFTSKPHEVHYVHSLTHAQQSNFSKRRNSNERKQFKSQNKRRHSSEESDSAEQRFKHFTDISDIDGQSESKRKGNANKQINQRRRYPLAIAASEHFKTVALPFLKTNNILSKSKLAINESLQKIRNIRPGMKERVTTETVLNNIKTVTTPRRLENKENITATPEKSTPFVHASENSVNSTSTLNTLNISQTSTETSRDSMTTTENFIQFTSENLHSLTTTDKTPQTVNIGDSVLKVDNPELFVEKWDSHKTSTDNLVYSGTSTENLYKSTMNTEKPIISATIIEKSNDAITQTDKAINSADIMKGSNQSDTEIKIPLIIVMGQSLPVSDMNNTLESNISDNIVTIEENNDTNKFMNTKENIITITPTSTGDEETRSNEIGHHVAVRTKRRINVIEEERVPTTSTGFRLSERGTPISIDFTFKNINT